MKKSIKKLSLNKITIANLGALVMDQKMGGIKPPTTVDTIKLNCPKTRYCVTFETCTQFITCGNCA